MGQVFVARHARMCRPSAVKVLKASGNLDLAALARFEREVQLSSSLTHPNTITIFDFGRAGQNTFYYAMEYLEGLDLQRLVKRFGPLAPARIVYLLTQVCGSLAEAHGRQIVHRDIKPANIFLTQRGGLFDYVKVLDFGLAKHVDSRDGEGVTQTGLILGTPEYMAPEAIRDEGSVDTRADLYGLGAVAYYLLTGQPPFGGGSAVQTLVDQVRKTPVPPSEITEIDVPVELETIVMRCLEKWPDDRFQSAEQLESALVEVPFEEAWDRNRAREWWSLRTGVARPVLYESAPHGDAFGANA
jgi:serine/threonine-protein kinase